MTPFPEIGNVDELFKPVWVGPVKRIQQEICKKYGVTMLDLLGHKRQRYIVIPRHEAILRAVKETKYNQTMIGREFNLDRTTINAVVRKAAR